MKNTAKEKRRVREAFEKAFSGFDPVYGRSQDAVKRLLFQMFRRGYNTAVNDILKDRLDD